MSVGIYFTLGDLGLQESIAILIGAAEGGAEMLEIGLPFTDPLLDGPVIQQSHLRALKNGEIPWSELCESIIHIQKIYPKVKISLMSSFQLFYEYDRLVQLPQVDGLLFTDLAYDFSLAQLYAQKNAPEKWNGKRVWFVSQNLVLSEEFSAPPEDISMVYMTRIQGITGVNQSTQDSTAAAIARIKTKTHAPIWLGFGVSNGSDVKQCLDFGANGAIIGSAFVQHMWNLNSKIDNEIQSEQRCTFLKQEASKWVKNILFAAQGN